MKKDIISVTAKLLEDFRVIDNEIYAVEDELYDLINSADMHVGFSEIYDYVCDDELFYEEDIQKIKELQNRLKTLQAEREDEYNREIKDLPQRTNKTNFEGFDITKTDPSYEEYMLDGNPNREYYMKKHGFQDVYIAEMTPEEYLLLCGKYGWKNTYDNVVDIYDNLSQSSKELIGEYARRMKAGEKAPMPVLNVKHTGQEGRHRAFAAIEAGINTIPVLIEV